MANYATHIAAGTVISGALATLTLAADVISEESLVAVTLAGVVGSILPDIDLRDSRASRILFSGIGAFASFCVLFLAAAHYSIAELWIIWLGSLILVRYGFHAVFHRVSVHRGVWHSLLAGAFCGVSTSILYHYVLGLHEGVAWLGGLFMFIGYIVHLVLDEMYSVDFMGQRLKASFGTALKFFDRRYPVSSAGMLAATVAALMFTPSTRAFVDGISSPELWVGLHEKLLPKDKWFGVIGSGGQIFVSTEGADGVTITTGSIPSAKSSPAEELSPAKSGKNSGGAD